MPTFSIKFTSWFLIIFLICSCSSTDEKKLDTIYNSNSTKTNTPSIDSTVIAPLTDSLENKPLIIKKQKINDTVAYFDAQLKIMVGQDM